MAFPCRERDLRVIRPFVYVREKSLRQFAESRDLPVIPENCPACFEAPKVSKEGSDDFMPVGRFRNPHVNSLRVVSKYISTEHPMMTVNKFHFIFTPVFSAKFATLEPDVTSIPLSTISTKFCVHEVAAYFENLEVDNLWLKNKLSFQY